MITIECKCVNEALMKGLMLLSGVGVKNDSRVGPVVVVGEPVSTKYLHPDHRVLISATRDANPVFHVVEALWMLAGRHDVRQLEYFNKRMKTFSDDGVKLHGAYGRRWRRHFGDDQLAAAIRELRRDPSSRRCVIGMWDPMLDPAVAANGGKDVPCNTQLYVAIRNGRLCMQICCRSNDAIWGAYGANAVHFSMLQEYLASMIGVPIGWMEQTSFNLHYYPEHFSAERVRKIIHESEYAAKSANWNAVPLVTNVAAFHEDLDNFMSYVDAVVASSEMVPPRGFVNRFFREVALPMVRAYQAHKLGISYDTFVLVADINDTQWRHACWEWFNRRVIKRAQA